MSLSRSLRLLHAGGGQLPYFAAFAVLVLNDIN